MEKACLKNKEQLDQILERDRNFDIVCRELDIGERYACIYTVDGFCKDELLEKLFQFMVTVKKEDMPDDARKFANRFVPYIEVELVSTIDQAVTQLLSGQVLVLIDGYTECILVDSRTYPARSVEEPEKDRALRGSRDGFVETMVFNCALIRRRIRDPKLHMEILQAGETSKTDIVLCYMEDRADPEIVAEMRKRINSIHTDALTMNQESLAECIYESKWFNSFPKFKFTERPDTASAQVLEGNVIVLVDNSPSAIILPTSIFDLVEEPDDYYFPPITGTYLRLARFVIAVLNFLLTPTYLLLMMYPDWIPAGLTFIKV